MAQLRSVVEGSFQTNHNAIPINVYSKVQTGPNNQLGGLKLGFKSVWYHVGISATVKIAPSEPKPTVNSKASINLRMLFIE